MHPGCRRPKRWPQMLSALKRTIYAKHGYNRRTGKRIWPCPAYHSPRIAVKRRYPFQWLEFLGDHEAIDEVAGGEAGPHSPEGFQIIDKLRAVLRGKLPKGFLLDDIQAKIPGLGAVLVEDFAGGDLQAIRMHPGLVIPHGLELNEHALLNRLDEFPGVTWVEILFFEPVEDGKRASGGQQCPGGSKEFLLVRIMRDRFDG